MRLATISLVSTVYMPAVQTEVRAVNTPGLWNSCNTYNLLHYAYTHATYERQYTHVQTGALMLCLTKLRTMLQQCEMH